MSDKYTYTSHEVELPNYEPATPRLWFQPTERELTEWKVWLKKRPPSIKAEAQRLKPWKVWRMKSTGQLVAVIAISEPEEGKEPTCRVQVWDRILRYPSHQVYGVDCSDLERGEVPPRVEMTFKVSMRVTDVDEANGVVTVEREDK